MTSHLSKPLFLAVAFVFLGAWAAPAAVMTLGNDGIFRSGQLAITVGPTGAITVGTGAQVLAKWGCLLELEGALRCTSADQELVDSQRAVDVGQGLLVITGKINTLDGKQQLTYTQRLQAVDRGIRVEVAYALPGGKDAIGVMQNRRRPFGLMALAGGDYAGAVTRAVTRDGKEIPGSVPVASSTGQANLVPQEAPVQSMTVWHPKAITGITVVPGAGSYVEFLDFRRWGNLFRFNVHPDSDRTSFTQTILLADPLPVAPCSLLDVTLGPDDAYLFPCDRPAVIRLQVVNNLAGKLRATLDWILEPWSGGEPIVGQAIVDLQPLAKEIVACPVQPPRRDLYRFTATAVVAGKTAAELRFPLASIVPLPRVKGLSPANHFGFQGHIMERGVTQLGFKWLFPFIYWHTVEPEKGRYDWAPLDEIVAYCDRVGASFMLSVSGTPEWAASLRGMQFDDLIRKYSADTDAFNTMLVAGGGLSRFQQQFTTHDLHIKAIPANWQDYRDFLTALLRRYGPKITHLSVANEIDGLNSFFGSPAEYVEFLKVSAETVRAVNSNVRILGIGSYSYTPTLFAKAVLAAGGWKYMDVYHWHPYYEVNGWDTHAREQFSELRKYSKTIPGWVTEFGNPSPPPVDGFPMSEAAYDRALAQTAAGNPPSKFFSVGYGAALFKENGRWVLAPNGPKALPEAEQAKSLIRFYATMLAEGVEKFNLHSGCSPVTEREPHASAVAQAMAAKTLGECKPIRRLASASPSFRGYLFGTPQGVVAVCWTQAQQETVLIRSVPKSVRIADLYGNPVPVTFSKGTLRLEVTGAPVYLLNASPTLAVVDPIKDFAVSWPSAVFAGDAVPLKATFRNALEVPISMKFTLTPPDNWMVEVAKPDISVKPGARGEQTMLLHVPESPDPGLKKITVEFQCWAGDLRTSQTTTGNLLVAVPRPCPPAPTDFRLDGDVAEWRGREPARMDSKGQIVWQTDELISQQTSLWTGVEDLSAAVWYAWDAQRLLVALEVKDNDVQIFTNPAGREYQGDCVEVFCDGRTSSADTGYGKGVYQMLWTPPTQPGETGRFAKARDATGVAAVGKRTATGYAVEMSVPFTDQNFPGFAARASAVFGFNIALDDLDSGKGVISKIQMTLNGIARNHVEPSSFMRLRFESQVARKNPIVNGGFEEMAGASAAPVGWRVTNGGVVSEGAHGGQRCLQLRRTDKGGAVATQVVALEPDKWYALTFSYRTVGEIGASYVKVDRVVNNVAVVPGSDYTFDSAGFDGWSQGTVHLYSGKGGDADIELRLFARPNFGDENPANAALWIDDLELRSLGSGDLQGELVENGSFEAGAVGHVPPGWACRAANRPMPTVALREEVGVRGSRAMEIAVGEPQDVPGIDDFVCLSGTRRLEPGKRYFLTFWGRSDKDAVLHAGVTGAIAFSHQFFLHPKWERYTIPLTITPDQEASPRYTRFSRLAFAGSLKQGNVRMWIDDVSLRQE